MKIQLCTGEIEKLLQLSVYPSSTGKNYIGNHGLLLNWRDIKEDKQGYNKNKCKNWRWIYEVMYKRELKAGDLPQIVIHEQIKQTKRQTTYRYKNY